MATCAAGAAHAQSASPETLALESNVLALSDLSANAPPREIIGNFEQMPEAARNDPRVIILYSRALLQMRRTEHAATALRRGLALHPKDARLRAELGAVYFLQRLDEASRLELELALGRDRGQFPLTQEERGEVLHFIDALEARRPWRLRAMVAIAPDNNVNAATAAEQVQIFGLPFALAPTARRKSGIGLEYDFNVEGGVGAEAAKLHWRIQGGVSGVDYRQSTFDQTQVSLHAGPRLNVAPRVTMGLDAIGEHFFYTGQSYSDALGVEANVSAAASVRTRYDLAVSYRAMDERRADARDGGLIAIDATLTHASRPDQQWRWRTFVQRGELETADNSYTLSFTSAGLYREAGGFGLYTELFGSYRQHDARDPLFNVRREDKEIGLQVRASRRTLRFFGATPFAGAQVSRRQSTNPLYDDARRERFEIGLTKTY